MGTVYELEDVWECPRCRREKPASEFYWTTGRGRSSYCKRCQNKYTVENRQRVRDQSRRRIYGLTPGGYAARLKSQGGVCAICGREPEAPPRYGEPALHVDHDHATGEVRGLLCRACNQALGFFDDDIERLRRAVTYLSGYTLDANLVERDLDDPTERREWSRNTLDKAVNTVELEQEEPTVTGVQIYMRQLSEGWGEPRSILSGLDRMPYDEEQKSRPNSDFAKRRKEQVYALQAVFQQLFNQTLSNGQAKLLLQNTADSAEDALDLMEDLQARIQSGKTRPDAPASYLLGMARRQRQDMTAPPLRRPAPVQPGVGANTAPDFYQADTSDDNYYLKEPTPRTKFYRDQIAKAIADGRFVPLKDDDDDD